MSKVDVSKLRNVALVSHGGAGKTSVAEAILFNAGQVDRLGKPDDGTALMDHDPEEVQRKTSINAAMAPCPWQGHELTIVDTPGYFDFVGEVKAALRVVDGGVMVIEAVSGVEVGTEMVWQYADENDVPLICFVNKLDRENASLDKVMEELNTAFSDVSIAPLQVPIGEEDAFCGVVDVLEQKAYRFAGDGSGKFEQEDVPAELADKVADMRDSLIEAAAESDDELIEKYLEGEELSRDEIMSGLSSGVRSRKVLPVLCGAAAKNIGVQQLLDAVTVLLPSPIDRGPVTCMDGKTEEETARKPDKDEPYSALVFKTMADPYVGKLTLFRVYSGTLKSDSQVFNSSLMRNERIGQLFHIKGKNQVSVDEVGAGDLAAVAKLQDTTTGHTLCDQQAPVVFDPIDFPAPVYTVAVSPRSKGDEEKVSGGLVRLAEEDPTFRLTRKSEAGQMVISGMGELHLDVIVARLKRKFGAEVDLTPPRTPYRETIKGTVKVEGKHKKQSGGRGQFGHVWIEMGPSEEEFEFEDKIFGGSVPRQYIPAVEKGIREMLQDGVIAGNPVTNVKVKLYDGSYHSVDSSEMAFKIAASMAFKKGFLEAKPALLEPIMKVSVFIPETFMGDVIGDLNKKRGRILGMEPQGTLQVVNALVPQSEMARYAIDLRSITQGRGTFTMEVDHYEEVPGNLMEEIVEQTKKEKEEE